MSDQSNHTHMSHFAKRQRYSKMEYRLYMALIFVTVLPFISANWAYRLIRNGTLPEQGPIQSALSEARTIASCIFWA